MGRVRASMQVRTERRRRNSSSGGEASFFSGLAGHSAAVTGWDVHGGEGTVWEESTER